MKNTLGTIEKGCYFASFRVEDGPHTGESFKITVFEVIFFSSIYFFFLKKSLSFLFSLHPLFFMIFSKGERGGMN